MERDCCIGQLQRDDLICREDRFGISEIKDLDRKRKKKGTAMIKDGDTVRRTDLHLRCYHIGLQTEIFRIDGERYVIYCKNVPQGKFEQLHQYFKNSIRPMGCWVDLVQEPPMQALEQLAPIPFSDAADDFKGLFMTRHDLDTAIIDRFPEVDVLRIDVQEGLNFSITITVAADTPQETVEAMREQFGRIGSFGTDELNMRFGTEEELRERERYERKRQTNPMIMEADRSLPFTLIEASTWYDLAPGIYRGEVPREKLSNPNYTFGNTACFLSGHGDRRADLRSALLLYDTVYLALPLERDFDGFLTSQAVSREELISLIAEGKLVLVLNNSECRYERDFLLNAYKTNKFSVIGRRGINTVVASYLVELRDRYLKRFPQIMDLAAEFYAKGIRDEDELFVIAAKVCSWPVVGVADSFDQFERVGPLGNSIVLKGLLEPFLAGRGKNDRDILDTILLFGASDQLVASALNATQLFFGSQDSSDKWERSSAETLSRLMLSYWYDDMSLETIRKIRNSTYEENSRLELFDSKKNVSLEKVVQLADQYNTRNEFRRLLNDLEKLDPVQRNTRIRQYNDILVDLSCASARGGVKRALCKRLVFSSASLLSLDPVETLLNAVDAAAEVIGSASSVQKREQIRAIRRQLPGEGLKVKCGHEENIYLLDKISKVIDLR